MTMSPSSPHPGQLIVLCGPSGVGKSTISRRLAERSDVSYTISATTRPERANEKDGKTYEYVSRDVFERRLESNEFLEYAQVHGQLYGTPKRPALDYLAQGKDVLLEIDVQGALQVRYAHPNALLIFLLPPDEPTLLKRLTGRGRDPSEEIARRFREAKREIHMAKGSRAFDFFVINDDLDRATNEIMKIIRHKRAGGI